MEREREREDEYVSCMHVLCVVYASELVHRLMTDERC